MLFKITNFFSFWSDDIGFFGVPFIRDYPVKNLCATFYRVKFEYPPPPPRVLFKISKLALKPCPVILRGMGKSSQASSYIAFPVWLKS